MESTPKDVLHDLELAKAIGILPDRLRTALDNLKQKNDLIEVVLDLGREPEARFQHDYVYLSSDVVTREELHGVVDRITAFGSDNRAGIESTLHRVSAIRNRQKNIVGLTCRIGRSVEGAIDIILDIVRSGKSICLLGPPGVGKTTILRECARVLAEDRKRVIIVDTSNEIGGDGDIPHPGIGHARRMQVADALHQHDIMIEAVENHMPEVIVIDEIGTELEAMAARTIAERGVQLIGTAHGKTLENLLMNPTLSDLVGGINTVTLSDEEARRRGTRKTVLERKAPPTFDILIEINARDKFTIWSNVTDTVDAVLRGYQPQAEIRQRAASGSMEVLQPAANVAKLPITRKIIPSSRNLPVTEEQAEFAIALNETFVAEEEQSNPRFMIFPYGISRNKIERAIQNLGVDATIARKWDEASIVITLKSLERRESDKLSQIASENIPIYAIKTNTTAQIMNALKGIFSLPTGISEEKAIEEAGEAIYNVLLNNGSIQLRPQNPHVRRLQHQLAESHNVLSESLGLEPNRYVRIYHVNDLPYGTQISA